MINKRLCLTIPLKLTTAIAFRKQQVRAVLPKMRESGFSVWREFAKLPDIVKNSVFF